jgi:hypothetical protein
MATHAKARAASMLPIPDVDRAPGTVGDYREAVPLSSLPAGDPF